MFLFIPHPSVKKDEANFYFVQQTDNNKHTLVSDILYPGARAKKIQQQKHARRPPFRKSLDCRLCITPLGKQMMP
jgi:hypothetical protein